MRVRILELDILEPEPAAPAPLDFVARNHLKDENRSAKMRRNEPPSTAKYASNPIESTILYYV